MKDKDAKWFDSRPRKIGRCAACHGSGTVESGYALVLAPPECADFAAPPFAIRAFVTGASDIFAACNEAAQIAGLAKRPVAFEFNGQVVALRPGDDAITTARRWWNKQYGETPEQTRARR